MLFKTHDAAKLVLPQSGGLTTERARGMVGVKFLPTVFTRNCTFREKKCTNKWNKWNKWWIADYFAVSVIMHVVYITSQVVTLEMSVLLWWGGCQQCKCDNLIKWSPPDITGIAQGKWMCGKWLWEQILTPSHERRLQHRCRSVTSHSNTRFTLDTECVQGWIWCWTSLHYLSS